MQPRLVSSQLGLVIARPVAMSKPGTRLTYIRGAVGSPICVAMTVFVGCAGLGYAGLLGALVAMLIVAALGASAARYKFVQRHLDASAALRDRSRLESARFKALRPTGVVRQAQYVELRDLVESIERDDAGEASRFELQDLLNHFVEVSVAHQRCLNALRLAGGELPVAVPMIDAPRSKRRREIQARRIRHRDECLRRIERLGDELEATDELIRLLAQRVACPLLHGDLDREIERRLWELDEVDAAIEQLSA